MSHVNGSRVRPSDIQVSEVQSHVSPLCSIVAPLLHSGRAPNCAHLRRSSVQPPLAQSPRSFFAVFAALFSSMCICIQYYLQYRLDVAGHHCSTETAPSGSHIGSSQHGGSSQYEVTAHDSPPTALCVFSHHIRCTSWLTRPPAQNMPIHSQRTIPESLRAHGPVRLRLLILNLSSSAFGGLCTATVSVSVRVPV